MDEKLAMDLRKNEARAIDELEEFLRVPSKSTDPAHWADIDQAATSFSGSIASERVSYRRLSSGSRQPGLEELAAREHGGLLRTTGCAHE